MDSWLETYLRKWPELSLVILFLLLSVFFLHLIQLLCFLRCLLLLLRALGSSWGPSAQEIQRTRRGSCLNTKRSGLYARTQRREVKEASKPSSLKPINKLKFSMVKETFKGRGPRTQKNVALHVQPYSPRLAQSSAFLHG